MATARPGWGQPPAAGLRPAQQLPDETTRDEITREGGRRHKTRGELETHGAAAGVPRLLCHSELLMRRKSTL